MVWYDLIRYCMCPFSRGALDVYEQGAINTTGCVSISAVAWRGNGLLFAMAGFLVNFFWLAIGSDSRIGNASAASVPQSHQQKLVSWHPKIYNNINLFSWDPKYIYIHIYIYIYITIQTRSFWTVRFSICGHGSPLRSTGYTCWRFWPDGITPPKPREGTGFFQSSCWPGFTVKYHSY